MLVSVLNDAAWSFCNSIIGRALVFKEVIICVEDDEVVQQSTLIISTTQDSNTGVSDGDCRALPRRSPPGGAGDRHGAARLEGTAGNVDRKTVGRRQSFIKQLQVSVKLRSISHSVAKTKCCSFIPSDIFIEIWEELGCEDDINFLKVSNLNPVMNMSGADS